MMTTTTWQIKYYIYVSSDEKEDIEGYFGSESGTELLPHIDFIELCLDLVGVEDVVNHIALIGPRHFLAIVIVNLHSMPSIEELDREVDNL